MTAQVDGEVVNGNLDLIRANAVWTHVALDAIHRRLVEVKRWTAEDRKWALRISGAALRLSSGEGK